MNEELKVIHYINQFFGGLGGEDKADLKPMIRAGFVGPGRIMQEALKDRGKVVATVICGDNYFAEQMEAASKEIIELIASYRADVLIAGPAFNAGRYGLACGELCKTVQNKLGIPAVTGMFDDNPGVDLYKKYIYIVRTTGAVHGLREAILTMVNLACKIASGANVGTPEEEQYFPQGFLRTKGLDKTAAERGIDMLLAKVKGMPFRSEISVPKFEKVMPAPCVTDLKSAIIALVTDGGLVPKGNPDKIQASKATRFGTYTIRDFASINAKDYEANHIGYDTIFINQDPNRLLPVDVMRDLENEGRIGKLYEIYYSTAGVGTTIDSCRKMGSAIAEQLKAGEVTAAILTST